MAMTTGMIAILNWYLPCSILLSVGSLILWALVRWGASRTARAPERWLAVGWLLVALALVLPGAWRAAGIAPPGGAAIEVWSGARLGSGRPAAAGITLPWAASADKPGNGRARPVPKALGLGIGLLAVGMLACLATLMLRRRRLGRICSRMPVVKRVGRVHVRASDNAPAPFAVRWQGLAFIVVPTSLLADSARLRLVIAHEAHHHRRGDLHAAALLGFLRALFFWNPLLALAERAAAELQDCACDRRVLRRVDVSAIAYCRALLWAAEAAHGQRYAVSGARGIADGSAAALKRRIEMLTDQQCDERRARFWLLTLAIAAFMVGTSWVVQGAVADHRVTRSQIDGLAARIEKRSGFPVVVDEQVVARINQWVAVPRSRDQMKKAMGRMPSYRGMIEETLRARGLPTELLGMVMAESSFDNQAHPATPVETRSMGIWQLIPSTGRQLGLEVSPARDQRLDPRPATEAAATLIAQLFQRYNDWPVAIAAYNAGQKKVDALIAGATSSSDQRVLVLAGQDEHARYVRAVMASVILIDNPSLLD